MTDKIKALWIDLNEELFTFIFVKVKNEDLSKDILQEVFIKVQTNIEQLKHTSKLTSWVYQITRNTIIDHFRKTDNTSTPLDDFDIPEDESLNFDYSRLTDCIHQKIENLSSQYKEAVVLTYLKNYSQKELAEHLKISYSGTKSRVQKARKILKENMLQCPHVESDANGNVVDYRKK